MLCKCAWNFMLKILDYIETDVFRYCGRKIIKYQVCIYNIIYSHLFYD